MRGFLWICCQELRLLRRTSPWQRIQMTPHTNPRIITYHESLLHSSRESLCKSFRKSLRESLCKSLRESSTDYRDKVLHYLQTRLYLPTDWLLLHTQSGLLSSYYIERVEIEQRSRAAAPDAAPDQAAEFTPQRNRSTKQNPTKVSPKGGIQKGNR